MDRCCNQRDPWGERVRTAAEIRTEGTERSGPTKQYPRSPSEARESRPRELAYESSIPAPGRDGSLRDGSERADHPVGPMVSDLLLPCPPAAHRFPGYLASPLSHHEQFSSAKMTPVSEAGGSGRVPPCGETLIADSEQFAMFPTPSTESMAMATGFASIHGLFLPDISCGVAS
jgi:hypothetical protein